MSLKDSVDELYKFRDSYFENHSSSSANKKIEDLSIKLSETLSILEHDTATISNQRSEHNLLRAKALNVLPDFNSEALEILMKLVKFHPKLTEAWNELGTCFWKKGDLKEAKSCFESALREKKNAEALRNLSMILRQQGETPEERFSNMKESLEKAKEAVNLNIQDGKSWYILGNAYQSIFFATDQNPSLLKQCLSSYSQAHLDESIRCNPDLYYNWAMALKYDENYKSALENLEKAIKYDPHWTEPKEQLETLTKHLENIQLMISKKGKLKPRKIKDLMNLLQKELASQNQSETHSNSQGKATSFVRCNFTDLQAGLNSGKVLKGKVICQVYCTDAPTFTFCIMDELENCLAVNVYNMNQGKGVIIGDTVAIFQPFVQHFRFEHKTMKFSFSSLKVSSPLSLEVNGKKLGHEMIATPRLSVTLKSE